MLTISDYHELLALNRALMEVRYLANDVDDATRGSAFLGRIHERVIDEIRQFLKDSGNEGESSRWDDWMRLEAREIEVPKILEYLSVSWSRLSPEEIKREVLINQLRPFKFTEDDVRRLVTELDQQAREPS